MQTDSVEKAAGIGAIGLWAALHGWLGWLVVLYAVCMMLDWVTGTVLAIKNGVWSSHKARQGLWHKGGSIIMIFVSVLTDILLGLTLNHISGLTLPFSYDMLLTPIVLFWYIMAFYTMYFIFLVRGFMVWSKFYFSVVSTVTPDSDKRFPHNMPDNKLLLCE